MDEATGGRSAKANMAVLVSPAELIGILAAAHARQLGRTSALAGQR